MGRNFSISSYFPGESGPYFEHIPEQYRGILGPLTSDQRETIKAALIKQLQG